jgi:hypothetical protein
MTRKVIFLIFMLILSQNNLFALETDTHKALNLFIPNITTPEGFNLDSYLKKNLGLEQGIEEVVSENKRIKYWLRDGGLYEDVPAWYLPYVRSVNHFHDPLSNKGLKGIANSSIQWALMPKGTQTVGGNYSWFDARDYFYQALTGKDKTIRNEYYGKTFRALGQLTHLVQDLSVPAHVRDDGHVITTSLAGNYQYYEKWVKANANIRSLASNPVFFDLSALSNSNPLGSVPIANLFDTNTFTGINPNVSTQKNIGLAEYTNPNFLSDDTIFTDDYLYPSKKWLELWTDSVVNRKYLRKSYDGAPVNHLAAVSWLYAYRLRYFPQGDQYLPVGLDPECHKEYAQKLIPRAVGYSAGLLNYFFRGEIDMVPATTGSGYVIENNSDEDMNGTFELWYDNKSDERVKVSGASWTLSIGKKNSGNNKSENITFEAPPDAKEQCKYILVLNKGQMGQEQGAVVGKVVKTIECAKIRAVKAAVSADEYLKITVYTEAVAMERIFSEISMTKEELTKVRFDVADYDGVMVLTSPKHIGPYYSGKAKLYKFKIDEVNRVINYMGVAAEVDVGEKITYGGQTVYCTSSYHIFGSEPQITKYNMYNYLTETTTAADFYLEKGNYKLFVIKQLDDDTRYYRPGGYSEPYKSVYTSEIIYGEKTSVIQETFNYPFKIYEIDYDINGRVWNPQTGGYELKKIGEGHDCRYDPSISSDYHETGAISPAYILNGKDYAYTNWSWDSNSGYLYEFRTTLPFQIPFGYIRTMIRKDGGYSFYTYNQYGGEAKSYSTEIGNNPINGMYLIGEKGFGLELKVSFYYWDGLLYITAMNKVRVINGNNIQILKTINTGRLSLSEQFDFTIKYVDD